MSNDTQSDTDSFAYGLPSQRDRDGNLQAVDHTFEFEDETITIKLRPPTVAEISEYEGLGEEVSSEQLAKMISRHIERPAIDDPTNLTARELRAYTQGIMDYNLGGGELAQAVHAELEDREASDPN